MRTHRHRIGWSSLLGTALTALVCVGGHAEELPVAGRYRVEVKLELPNVLGAMPFRTVERCLAPGDASDALFLIVSNPVITTCPVRHRSLANGRLELEIVCERINTGQASARYNLAATGYTARIDVTMGGKNMTLTETQRGERIGDCR